MRYRTDAEALAGDWYALGSDLRRAMGHLNRHNKHEM